MDKRILRYVVIGKGWKQDGSVEISCETKEEEEELISRWITELGKATNCEKVIYEIDDILD